MLRHAQALRFLFEHPITRYLRHARSVENTSVSSLETTCLVRQWCRSLARESSELCQRLLRSSASKSVSKCKERHAYHREIRIQRRQTFSVVTATKQCCFNITMTVDTELVEGHQHDETKTENPKTIEKAKIRSKKGKYNVGGLIIREGLSGSVGYRISSGLSFQTKLAEREESVRKDFQLSMVSHSHKRNLSRARTVLDL